MDVNKSQTPSTTLEETASEMKVICRERRTGLIDRALCRIIVEVDEEALLHVNGSDAHDGREEQKQIGDQLHIDDVRFGVGQKERRSRLVMSRTMVDSLMGILD